MDESAALLMDNPCVLCSYSGFPVLNAELCEPQEGTGIPMATTNSRHTSPGSPAAIFRRSKQVRVTYWSLCSDQTAWLLLLLLFNFHSPSHTLSLSCSDLIPFIRRLNQPSAWPRHIRPYLTCGPSVCCGIAMACGLSACQPM